MFTETRKNIRKNVIDNVEKLIRKCGISDNKICSALRFLHASLPVVAYSTLLFGSKFYFLLMVCFKLFIFVLYIFFHGCILTKIEHCFTENKCSTIDPFLNFINIELTNENRYKYALITNIALFFVVFLLYYIRFGLPDWVRLPDFLKKRVRVIDE